MKLPLALILIVVSGLFILHADDLKFETPVTLRGTISILYDMSFVDSDIGPVADPSGIKVKFPDPERAALQKPIPHNILILDRAITVSGGKASESHPPEKNVTEIDLGGSKLKFKKGDHVVVTGTLWPAITVHHLRPVMMTVSSASSAPKAEQDAAANP